MHRRAAAPPVRLLEPADPLGPYGPSRRPPPRPGAAAPATTEAAPQHPRPHQAHPRPVAARRGRPRHVPPRQARPRRPVHPCPVSPHQAHSRHDPPLQGRPRHDPPRQARPRLVPPRQARPCPVPPRRGLLRHAPALAHAPPCHDSLPIRAPQRHHPRSRSRHGSPNLPPKGRRAECPSRPRMTVQRLPREFSNARSPSPSPVPRPPRPLPPRRRPWIPRAPGRGVCPGWRRR